MRCRGLGASEWRHIVDVLAHCSSLDLLGGSIDDTSMGAIFDMIDVDNDGRLTRDELVDFLTRLFRVRAIN